MLCDMHQTYGCYWCKLAWLRCSPLNKPVYGTCVWMQWLICVWMQWLANWLAQWLEGKSLPPPKKALWESSAPYLNIKYHPNVVEYFICLHFLLVLSSFTTHFPSVNRTMCPRNVTVTQNVYGREGGFPLDMEETAQFLFFIDVFTSSEEPVHYSIKVEVVPHFFLE